MEKSNFRRKPKQARSQERYDRILDTAANLFLEKGFDATSTNEIAKEAAISIGSVYQYFDDKKGIAKALTERYVKALREITDAVLATDVADLPNQDAIPMLMAPILDFHFRHPTFRSLWLATEGSPELRASMEAMDDEVRGRVQKLFEDRAPGIPREKARVGVAVMHLALQALLGAIARSDDTEFNEKATSEMLEMIAAYVDKVALEHQS